MSGGNKAHTDTQGAEEAGWDNEPSPVLAYLATAWLGALPILALIVAWQQGWV